MNETRARRPLSRVGDHAIGLNLALDVGQHALDPVCVRKDRNLVSDHQQGVDVHVGSRRGRAENVNSEAVAAEARP